MNEKRNRKQVNVAKLADMDGFFPHYQHENPFKFHILLKRFTADHYKGKNGEKYMSFLRTAIRTVNHQMMLNKLHVDRDDDYQRKNPEAFQREFERLAKKVPHLDVQDGKIAVKDSLSPHLVNTLYEQLWLKANERVGAEGRTV